MALATTVSGDGILVSSSKTSNVYSVTSVDGAITFYKETTARETRQWVALTQSAAETTKNANVQPATGTYTYEVSEQNRITLGYSLTRMFENKITALVDPYATATVAFDPGSGAYAAGGLSVTLSSETDGATIVWWKDDSGGVTNPAEVDNVTAVSVTVPGTIYAYAYAIGYTNSATSSAVYTEEEE